jgi:hypothetical protein
MCHIIDYALDLKFGVFLSGPREDLGYSLTVMAATGQASAISFRSHVSHLFLKAFAILSFPISKQSGQVPVHRPHPMHLSRSTQTVAMS